MFPIQVTCAIILFGSKTLVVQRSAVMSMPLKWEFPGGKVEAGESVEACIRREIKEELVTQLVAEKIREIDRDRFHINTSVLD